MTQRKASRETITCIPWALSLDNLVSGTLCAALGRCVLLVPAAGAPSTALMVQGIRRAAASVVFHGRPVSSTPHWLFSSVYCHLCPVLPDDQGSLSAISSVDSLQPLRSCLDPELAASGSGRVCLPQGVLATIFFFFKLELVAKV